MIGTPPKLKRKKTKEERNMKNIIDELTAYRLKVARDGKEIVNVPGILALPGVLVAPKISIFGTIAASLLGCDIHLENENGKKTVYIEFDLSSLRPGLYHPVYTFYNKMENGENISKMQKI